MYACRVCAGTDAMRACNALGSVISSSGGGEGVIAGSDASGDSWCATLGTGSSCWCCEDEESIDGAGVCCCFGNWNCVVVEGPASTMIVGSGAFRVKKPNTMIDISRV